MIFLKKAYYLTLTIILASAHASTASATTIDFGAASNYNAFFHNNFSANSSDVEGRVAVGGNVSISNYSINIKNGTQLYTDTSINPALVVGGDLNYTSGQIAGDVYVRGSYTGNSSASITNGSLSQGGISPIDFDAEFNLLTELSRDLSVLPVNSYALDLWSTQYLTGAGSNGVGGDLHSFLLDPSDMSFSDYRLSDVDDGDTIIFNVSGKDINTRWGNFAGSDNSLADLTDHIIFNFFEAESLTINAAMFGSILAPKADITAAYGLIEGQVIGHSWTGSTQINARSFTPSITHVPEPTSLALLGLGLMGFGVFSRRQQSI